MTLFQNFDVSDSTIQEILEKCVRVMEGQTSSGTAGYEISIALNVLDVASGRIFEVTAPTIYSYRYFKEMMPWIERCILLELDGKNILSAEMRIVKIINRCDFCQEPVNEWWNHVRYCGGPRCERCLELKSNGDHTACSKNTYYCQICNAPFNTGMARHCHQKRCQNGDLQLVSAALDSRFEIHRLVIRDGSPDYEGVLVNNIERIMSCIEGYMEGIYSSLKFYLCIDVLMSKLVRGDQKTIYFTTTATTVIQATNLWNEVRMHTEWLIEKIAKYVTNGSGWVVHRVASLNIMITKYCPIGGAGYLPLPDAIKTKLSIVNPQNDDNKCFLWACLSILFPTKDNRHRIGHYIEYQNALNMSGVRFPVEVENITPIEVANRLVISVFKYHDKDGIIPVRISEQCFGTEINLLLVTDGPKQHYAAITNKSAFFSTCETVRKRNKTFYCSRCIQSFRSLVTLDKHMVICRSFKSQKTKMPDPGKCHMQFEAFRKTVPEPCWVVADFETINEPSPIDFEGTSKTRNLAHLKPSGYAFKVCSDYPEYDLPPEYYIGNDAAQMFLDRLNEVFEDLMPLIWSNVPATPLTAQEQLTQFASPSCHICKKPFDPTECRAIDHCHYPLKEGQTSNYLGPSHIKCNVERQTVKKLPVIFHNLTGFDIHLFFKELCRDTINLSEIRMISKTAERYISVTTPRFVFVDSLKHMTASLDNLVSGLDVSELKNLEQYCRDNWPNDWPTKMRLLARKGVFPYSYVTSLERLDDDIPNKACFKNLLDDTDISEDDYQYVLALKDAFNLKTVRDLQILYNVMDVVLLADVWANYRNRCLKEFGLEPAKFIGCPSFSWAAALKLTGVRLDLLTDSSMYNLFERGIVGGISVICKRYARANNCFLEDFDPSKPSTHILYLDAVNLYGRAMQGMLPYSNFKWENEMLFTRDAIMNLDEKANRGYVLEVDLTIPEEHHSFLDDYPIAPSKLDIDETLISPYSTTVRNIRQFPPKFSSRKLAPNLLPKINFIVSLPNLKLYVSLGAVITKVHRVVSFVQKRWLKPFVDLLTEQRRTATTEFEQLKAKLGINASFGKSMQNCRNYTDIKLIREPDQQKYQISKPEFKRFTIFEDDLVAVETGRRVVTLDRPIYAGFTILEASKLIMFQFFYGVLKVRFPSLNLLFTDTDSLLIEVESSDIVKDLKDIEEHFDFSNLPEDHPLYNDCNRMVPGKFKLDVKDKIVREFVGLRSKLYSVLLADSTTKQASSGVKQSVAKARLSHQRYLNTLSSLTDAVESQNTLRSKKHDMLMIATKKVALTNYDDKRYIESDGVTTRAYGNVCIKRP